MEEVLKEYNPWWYEPYTSDTIRRSKYLDRLMDNIDNKNIIVITGLRRVGKTTIIKQMITELLRNKTPSKNIFYVSVDNFELRTHSIREIIDGYREINKIPMDEKSYIFLDEIAFKEDFHQEIKNLYDMTNLKIIISSSSASILR